MAAARIVNDGQILRVHFDYDPELIDTLKTGLPKPARRWSPEERCWLVLPRYLDQVVSLLERHGYTVTITDRTASRPPPRPGSAPAHPAGVTRDCLVRALSHGFHPDHGGDPELQRLVNDLAADLKLRRVS